MAPPLRWVRIVIVGHVDHGKLTLVGRLLHETGSPPDGKLQMLTAVSERRGMPFEWSFLLDALQTERDQGITIDTTRISLRTASRDIVLIDAPGHAEFLRCDVIAHIGVAPRDTRRIRALIFWLHDQPLTAGQSILLWLGTRESRATVVAIEKAAKVDIADMVATDRFGLDLRELTPINRWRPIFTPTTCAPGGWCWKSTAGSPATGWCSAFEAASAPRQAISCRWNPNCGQMSGRRAIATWPRWCG
jgi:sulfate adenylyltransferase subunit 1 (EFTu-like GTPase family)